MTNKQNVSPMLSVEREILELAHTVFVRAGYETVASKVKALLYSQDVQQQGYPVAKVRQSPIKKHLSVDLLRTDLKDGELLYAEQPASVAVVVPERMYSDSLPSWAEEQNLVRGWNACLDEYARLNGTVHD